MEAKESLMTRSVLGFAILAIAAAGCAGDADDVGTVGVPLTSAGSGGSTYRLPAGTRLVMSGGTFYDEFSLDGDTTFVRIDVPVGDYETYLVHDAGYDVSWPLERTDLDGTVETVNAVLTTPMPAALTIAEGALTNLVLSFDVPGAGPVVFAHGEVEVTIDVDETVAGGMNADLAATMDVTSVAVDSTTPPALVPRLPAFGATGVGLQLGGHVAAPWTQASATSACTTLDMTTFSSSDAGIADLLGESISPSVQLCVYGGDGVPPQVQIFTVRAFTGAAATPTFADLGDQAWLFVSLITADLPAQVFDGTTLDLQELAGVGVVPGTALTRASVRLPGETARRTWYRATWSGNVDLSILLTP
jgi:hypothetical protein